MDSYESAAEVRRLQEKDPEMREIMRQAALRRERLRTILEPNLKKRPLEVEQLPGAEFRVFPVDFYNTCVNFHINRLGQLEACCTEDFFSPNNISPNPDPSEWKRGVKILYDKYGLSIPDTLDEIDPRKFPLRPIAASQNKKLARVADWGTGLLTFGDLRQVIRKDPQFLTDWLVDSPLNGQDGEEMFRLVIEELQKFQMLSMRSKVKSLLGKK